MITDKVDFSQILEQLAAVDGHHLLAEALLLAAHGLVHVPITIDFVGFFFSPFFLFIQLGSYRTKVQYLKA